MCTDGTVTRSLQAYYQESIDVDVVKQEWLRLGKADNILASQADDEVIYRCVTLRGQSSGRTYACAQTFLNPQNLPSSLSLELMAGEIGVGELLQLRELETYRELLGNGAANVLPEEFQLDLPSGESNVWRHYSIRHRGKVLMHIKESFLLASFS